jgi:RNA polymerase sigma-70 factor, ECF subfamily
MKRFSMDEILDLIVRTKTGDRGAFGLLYDRYVQDVYRFLLSKTLRKEEAQDLTSETFTKALDKIKSFSPKRNTSFRAWLFTIAHRSFLDGVRSRHRSDVALERAEEIASAHSPAKDVERELLRAKITEVLAKLSDVQRETIVLRVWHDCSFAEIAHILGKSEAAIKMQMKRALVAPKDLLPPHLFILLLSYVAS